MSKDNSLRMSSELIEAARCGDVARLERLLSGAGINSVPINQVFNIFHAAIEKDHVGCVEALLKVWRLDNEFAKETGSTPLIVAIAENASGCFKLLLDHGASLTATDFAGRTPLLVAAKNGAANAIEPLLNAGSDLEACDNLGYTAVMLAANFNQMACLKILVERGANLNLDAIGGLDDATALLMAAKSKHSEPVLYLIEHGADVEAVDRYGKSLRDISPKIYAEYERRRLEQEFGMNVEEEPNRAGLSL